MSNMVVCRYCEETFVLRPGKPGYRNECPACLIERTLEAAKPNKSKLEENLAASGLTKEQIAKRVDTFAGTWASFSVHGALGRSYTDHHRFD